MPTFPKTVRLKNAEDFERVWKSSVQKANRYLVLRWSPSNNQKLGLIVSKSVGNAVVRNRLKRVFRDYFRLHREDFPQAEIIIIARPPVHALDNASVRKELCNLLKK